MPILPPSLRITLVLVAAGIVGLSCSDNTGPTAEQPLSLRVEAPDHVADGQPFQLRVTAHGSNASVPLAGFSGSAQVTVSSGTITPASVPLSGGVSTVQATISGATGEVMVRATLATLEAEAALSVLPADRLLLGHPDDPAESAIPEMVFRARAADYATDHPDLPGVYISFNTLTLVFHVGTTVGQANEVLAALEAEIVGGIKGVAGQAAGILNLRLPATAHEQMDAALTTLRSNGRVRSAVQDALQQLDALPPKPAQPPAGSNWVWSHQPGGGNFGLELIRVPFMWNLNRKVEHHTVTGVLDVGFTRDHPDLQYFADLTPSGFSTSNESRDHGTHVAGIIGATFDNRVGVEGINPFARLMVRPIAPPVDPDALPPSLVSVVESHHGLYELIIHSPPPRVINLSIGHSWYKEGKDSATDPVVQQRIQEEAASFIVLLDIVRSRGHSVPLMVLSAGNSRGQPAEWNSGYNYAGMRASVDDVIVVESVANFPTAPGGARPSSFTNTGGHVSAPGGEFVDAGGQQVWSTGHSRLFLGMEGTSMAAPHVTGLASYLLSVDPGLSNAQLRELLLRPENTMAVTGGSRRIDAFAAVMDIDRLRGDNRVLRMLVDIDDGTPDGNMRIDPRDGTEFTADEWGDGRVDMRDFRRWRDGFLYLSDRDDLALDGMPDHPKRDLNGNGDVSLEDERIYPFVDLNGDGLWDNSAAFVPGLGEVTDVEMIQRLFEDHHYEAADLDDLLYSADIAIHPEKLRNAFPDAEIRSSIRPAGSAAAQDDRRFRRLHTGDSEQGDELWQVYTVASWTDYTGRIEVVVAPDDTLALEKTFSALPGEDSFWDPSADCSELANAVPAAALAVAQSAGIVCAVTVEPETITLAPGATQQFTATVVVVGSTNEEVTWTATGGTISAGGLYVAGQDTGDFTVRATSQADPQVWGEATVTVAAASGRAVFDHSQVRVSASAYADLDSDLDEIVQPGVHSFEGDVSASAQASGHSGSGDASGYLEATVVDEELTAYAAGGTASFELEHAGGSGGVGGGGLSDMLLVFEVVEGAVSFRVEASVHVSKLADVSMYGGTYLVELKEVRASGGGTIREIFYYHYAETQETSLELDESGVLEPGRYILWTAVGAHGSTTGASCASGCSRSAEGSHSLTLTFGEAQETGQTAGRAMVGRDSR
jgi:hypothetical protein